MAVRKIASKKFKLKKDATAWAKDEKKRAGKSTKIKWETNRTSDPNRPWEAVVFREVK